MQGTVSLAHLHELLPESPDDDAALSLLLLATAALDEETFTAQAASDYRAVAGDACPDVIAVFTKRSGYWRDGLERYLDHADVTVPSLALAVAALNPLLSAEEMAYGVVHTRVDGLLDMLGCPVSCVEIQEAFEGVGHKLAEESGSPAVARSVYGGQLLASATAGYFGFVGGHVNRALMSMGDFLKGVLTGQNTFAQETAVLTTATLLFWDLGFEEEVHRIRRAMTDDLARRSGEIARLEDVRESESQRASSLGARDRSRLKTLLVERRVLRGALEVLSPDEHEGDEDGTVPDVVETGLEDARRVLASYGLVSVEEDAVKPGGASRGVWSASNWVVVSQSPMPGQPRGAERIVQLRVRKRGE